jgi:AcrR family transcriptional regulator
MATPTQQPTGARPSRGRRTPKVSGDERERAILSTFEALLEERSFHAISIDDVARGAGISRPTFYFYFASKEAVLLSLFERMIAEGMGAQGDALERLADDPAAAVRESLTAYFKAFGSHRAVTLAGADARVSSADVRALWSQIMEVWVTQLADAIEAERVRGNAPAGVPARDLAIALVRMNESSFYATFAGQAPAIGEDDVVDVLVAVWLNAIYGTAGS